MEMMQNYRVNTGGLMRCCLETLRLKAIDFKLPTTDTAILRCEYCDSHIILRDGIWKWAH